MHRLWVHLSLGSALITVGCVLLVALLVNQQVDEQFRSFVALDQVRNSPMMERLTTYYGEQGSWAGVEAVFYMRGGGRGHGMGMMHGAPDFILADASGQVVYTDDPAQQPGRLDAAMLRQAVPVVWQEQTVGYLVVRRPGGGHCRQPRRGFWSR